MSLHNSIEILEILYNKKINSESFVIKNKLIDAQLAIINKIYTDEKTEKAILDDLFAKITKKEAHLEFNISEDVYKKLLKEKDLNNNLTFIFRNEIIKFNETIKKISVLLIKQKELNSLSYYNALEDEKILITTIKEDFDVIINSEHKLSNYFKEIQNLKYDIRTIKTGQIISKIIKGAYISVKLAGIENIPKKGPCIMASRHYDGTFDAVIFLAIINRPIYFISTTEGFLVNQTMENYAYKLGLMPIKRDEKEYGGIRKKLMGKRITQKDVDNYPVSNQASELKAITQLGHGNIICIFPEAYAHVNDVIAIMNRPQFLEPRDGFVWLAYFARKRHGINVPIVPVGISYKNYGVRLFATVNIGAPVFLDDAFFNIIDKTQLKELIAVKSKEIMNTIIRLSS
ncbi:MAG: 1-acyl-sn-glycerol-3-phosphate acyltransferase [Candidatus Woesearchaeota archaeon]